MSKRTAPKDSKASGFKTLKAFFTSGPKKSPTSSTATTPEPDNPGSSTPETPIHGPSRLLEPLAPLATIKDESLSSISSISPLSEQALHSPSLQLTGHGQGHQVCTAGHPQQTPTASLAIRTCDETRKTRKANFRPPAPGKVPVPDLLHDPGGTLLSLLLLLCRPGRDKESGGLSRDSDIQQAVQEVCTPLKLLGFISENSPSQEIILARISETGLGDAHLIGQSYDGAATMSGVRGGVQAIIKEHHPAAVYLHCAAHCLNLTLVNSSKVLPIGRAFALISRIITLLRGSAKRSDAFCENIRTLQSEASKTATPKMSDTRWVERHDAVLTFIQLKPSIEATLEDISNWPGESCASD